MEEDEEGKKEGGNDEKARKSFIFLFGGWGG